MNKKYDAIIIGGGAAGLMCGIEAGKRNKKVLILDKAEKIGAKILISGGGRCNFTNINATPNNFISSNPHYCKSALNRYTPNDFIKLVAKYDIEYYEKKLGQLFCKKNSREIIKMLLAECELAKVEIQTSSKIEEITHHNNEYLIKTQNEYFNSQSLVIACGGLSFPSKGATDFGYKIAKQFGHSIIQTKPGLVPFTLNAEENLDFTALSGISVDSIVKTKKIEFRENILFTHRGLSGPAILQISNYIGENKELTINLDPKNQIRDKLDLFSKKLPLDILSEIFSKKLATEFVRYYDFNKPLNQMGKKRFNQLIENIYNWKVIISGTEGYKKAEVTLGGVNTKELSSKTMESKLQNNLYLIGEVVDVTGWLGGYNFTWAWASGWVAGQNI